MNKPRVMGIAVIFILLTTAMGPSPVLIITGKLTDSSGQPIEGNFIVEVANQDRDIGSTSKVSSEGEYIVTFISMDGASVAAEGDKLEISVVFNGWWLAASETHELKADEIAANHVAVDIAVEQPYPPISVLAVSGTIRDMRDGRPSSDFAGLPVQVRNKDRKSLVANGMTNESGQYALLLMVVDPGIDPMAADVGETIVSTVWDARGKCFSTESHMLTEEDVHAAHVSIDLLSPPRPGSIFVSSEPEGARVYMGGNYGHLGEFVGISPMTISDLCPGEHVVNLVLDGYELSYNLVEVQEGETTNISAEMLRGVAPKYTEEYLVGDVRGISLNSSSNPVAPCIIDWNMDGMKDIVIGDANGQVLYYENIGTDEKPEFQNGVLLLSDAGLDTTVFAVDWNKDRLNDLVIGSGNGDVIVYKNTETNIEPIFSEGEAIASVGSYAVPWVTDWNRDNKRDLLVGDGGGNINLFLDRGTDDAPEFGKPEKVKADGSPISIGNRAAPCMFDWDSDGGVDLIVGCATGEIYVYTNAGTYDHPSFAEGIPVKLGDQYLTVSGNSIPFVVDWNNDDYKDLVLGNGNGQLSLLLSIPVVRPYLGCQVGEILPRWDTNQDCVVDILDLVLVGSNHGKQPSIDENADVNLDGKVDMLDLILVAKHLGERYDYIQSAAPPASSDVVNLWFEAEVIDYIQRLLEVRLKLNGQGAQIYGYQFDLAFSPTILEIVSAEQGNIFSKTGRVYWLEPKIDNKEGIIKGIASTRLASTEKVYANGTLATITIKLKSRKNLAFGWLDLQNVMIIDHGGRNVSGALGGKVALESIMKPAKSMLLQNYPNPFNPDTWIPYQLGEDANVEIMIYTATGQLVRTLSLGHKSAGFYTGKERAAYWDGKNEIGEFVTSGIYFYNILGNR